MKIKKIFAGAGVFIAVCCVSALVSWLGGYDFDRRNVDVGMWSFLTIAFGSLLTAIVVSEIRE